MVRVFRVFRSGREILSEINEYEANNYFKIDFVISRLNENFAIATVKIFFCCIVAKITVFPL